MPQRERHAADTEQCGACGPFTPSGFAKLLARAGDEAKIGFKLHPHMLRHACGYALANKGIDTRTLQAYLGDRSIGSYQGQRSTVPASTERAISSAISSPSNGTSLSESYRKSCGQR